MKKQRIARWSKLLKLAIDATSFPPFGGFFDFFLTSSSSACLLGFLPSSDPSPCLQPAFKSLQLFHQLVLKVLQISYSRSSANNIFNHIVSRTDLIQKRKHWRPWRRTPWIRFPQLLDLDKIILRIHWKIQNISR